MRSPEARQLPMRQHADWAKKAKHLMWRPNLGSQAGLNWGMPDVAMTQAGEDFRFVADNHCNRSVLRPVLVPLGHTKPALLRAGAHLAWDPYCRRGCQ